MLDIPHPRKATPMSARILVVEDEEALTTLLRYNLDAEGYDVETVGRGDEADTRVKGLLRRASPERLATLLAFGDIELDREKRRVARSGRPVDLGPTEYRLLEFFLEHPARVFSREQLLDSVWGRDIYIDERTVDVHIGRLRKLLNPGGEQDPIRTVRGAGYALDDRFAKAE